MLRSVVFFNDTATTEIYTLSLHDALPISWTARRAPSATRCGEGRRWSSRSRRPTTAPASRRRRSRSPTRTSTCWRSEEHTSELQSRQYLVCRLLLEKKQSHASV